MNRARGPPGGRNRSPGMTGFPVKRNRDRKEYTMHAEIMEAFDALEGEHREMFAADLERHYSPEALSSELRTTAQLVEGFCVAVEEVGPVALLVMSDCRERVRQALEAAS
jgi:hypothetical protein